MVVERSCFSVYSVKSIELTLAQKTKLPFPSPIRNGRGNFSIERGISNGVR